MIDPVELRPATVADAPALERLAQLDSARVPTGQVLVASSGGKLVAALSVQTGEAIADPFTRSAHLVAALRVQAAGRRMETSWTPSSQPLPAT